MRQAGLVVEEALLAATTGGAELSASNRLGRVAPGYVFDAMILDGDPGDLSGFADPGVVSGVFK